MTLFKICYQKLNTSLKFIDWHCVAERVLNNVLLYFLTCFIRANIHLFKVNNGSTRKISEICSKLTIKKPSVVCWLWTSKYWMEKTPHKVYSENMFLLIKKISSESSLFLYVFLQCCNHFKFLPVNFSFPVNIFFRKTGLWFLKIHCHDWPHAASQVFPALSEFMKMMYKSDIRLLKPKQLT